MLCCINININLLKLEQSPHLVDGRVGVDLADVSPVVLLDHVRNDEVEVAGFLEMLMIILPGLFVYLFCKTMSELS